MLSRFHIKRTGGFSWWNELSGSFNTNESADFGFTGQANASINYYFGGFSSDTKGTYAYVDGDGVEHIGEVSPTEIDLSTYDGQAALQRFYDASDTYIVQAEEKLTQAKYNLMVEGVKRYALENQTKIYIGEINLSMGFGDQGFEVVNLSGSPHLEYTAQYYGIQNVNKVVNNIWLEAYNWTEPSPGVSDSCYEWFANSLLQKAIEEEYITDPDIIEFSNENTWDEITETRANWTVNIDGVRHPEITVMWEAPGITSGDIDGETAVANLEILTYSGATSHWLNLGTFNYGKRIYKTSWTKLAEQGALPALEKLLSNIPIIGDFVNANVGLQMYITYYQDGVMSSTSTAQLYVGYNADASGSILPPRDGSTITITHRSTDEAIEDFLDDIDLDNLDDPTVTDPTLDQAFSGVGLLTRTYVITKSRLQALGEYLWTRDFFDYIQDLNASPIENIVSVKVVPFNIPSGSETEIFVGNVGTGVLGNPVDIDYNCKHTIGTVTIEKKYPANCNFLNSNTFTKLSIFLPFIGFKELDASLFLDKALKVEYINDIITGNCKAVIYADNVPICDFSGQIGLDIPISAQNRAQVELGLISAVGQGAASIASGNVGGMLSSAVNIASNAFHTETRGANSPSVDSFMTHDCFYILENAIVQYPSRYNHTHGRPLNLSKTLRNMTGFTVCEDVDVSGIQGATKEELEYIKDMLEKGVYL